MGSTLNGKNLGSKFFPFIVDPFQKGPFVQENKQEVTHVVTLVKRGGKSTCSVLKFIFSDIGLFHTRSAVFIKLFRRLVL